jgi:large subunit ribosomal protein L9
MPEGPLKHVGEFPLVVGLYLDVTANITVIVLGEAATG